MSSTFQERLIEAMKIRDMAQVDLVKATGLSKAQMSQYVNGTYEAKQKALYALAEALNVNVSWLMGNDVPMEIDYEQLHQEVNACELIEKAYGKEAFELVRSYLELNEKDRKVFNELISLYSQLDTYDKGSVIERIKVLLEQEKYSVKKESSNGKAM